MPPLKQFILPGGSENAALAHLSRTICRRAERELLALTKKEKIRSECLVYLNRLSDWFFLLARYLNTLADVEDVIWEGRH